MAKMKLCFVYIAPMLLLSMLLLAILTMASNVTYDRRSLIIDGQRKLLISASIHYPRSVPAVSFKCAFNLFLA